MTNNYLFYLFLGLALIAFSLLALKPTAKTKRFKNLFWVLGDILYLAGLYFGYLSGHSWEFPVIMLFAANFGLVMQLKKGKEKPLT